jgi:hypothetical protein
MKIAAKTTMVNVSFTNAASAHSEYTSRDLQIFIMPENQTAVQW